MTPPRRFLFCVVGVGAGNTTRNLAILRELQEQGPCEILIAAQGRALELLSEHYPTVALRQVSYTQSGNFSLAEVLTHNLSFPLRYMENVRRLTGIMEDFSPHLVVADSDFYCLRPARRLGFPLVSINNSAVVVETIRRAGNLPPSCRASYHLIERTDYWLQRRYPRRVLCPTVRHVAGLPRKFVQIPPMVRPDIRPVPPGGREVVIITGGSGIDAGRLDFRCLAGEPLRILGSHLDLVPPDAHQIGFTLDVAAHLKDARVLVVQGGFSSISEAVALRIPTVVVPIANHAEQWANGQSIEALGIGLAAPSAAEAGRTVRRVLANYDRHLAACRALRLRTDGHRVAARMLWRWAGGGFRAIRDQ